MTQRDNSVSAIKRALSELIREVAHDKKNKEKLAKYLGKSVSAVEAMAYQQKGSFDSWVSTLLFLLDLSTDEAIEGLKDLKVLVRKTRPLLESDKIWANEIHSIFTEDEKIYWLNMMRYSDKLKTLKK